MPVTLWMVVIMPRSILRLSWMTCGGEAGTTLGACRRPNQVGGGRAAGTLTTGARQLVVQEAAVQMGMSAVSLSSLTPTTTLRMLGSFIGKLHTTFFTPAWM